MCVTVYAILIFSDKYAPFPKHTDKVLVKIFVDSNADSTKVLLNIPILGKKQNSSLQHYSLSYTAAPENYFNLAMIFKVVIK